MILTSLPEKLPEISLHRDLGEHSAANDSSVTDVFAEASSKIPSYFRVSVRDDRNVTITAHVFADVAPIATHAPTAIRLR